MHLLITSRSHLSGLVTAHDASLLDLDALTDGEARALLDRRLGPDRLTAEPAAAAELLRCCAGLPLALSVVAARADAHPEFPLAILADELRDRASRLDALDAGELSTNLRAVLSWSYHTLTAEAATVFRWLGLAPGPDISLSAIANMAALSVYKVRALLGELEHAHLVQQHVPGRYRAHDLVRLYAAERANDEHSEDARDKALARLVDFYLHTASFGARLLFPHSREIELGKPVSGCVPNRLEDVATTLAWFDTEHQCLLAAQRLTVRRNWHERVWRMAWALTSFHRRRGHLRDSVTVCEFGVEAAEQSGTLTSRAWAHRLLGYALSRVAEHAQARTHLLRALTLTEEIGDVRGQANTHRVLARDWTRQGDYERALNYGNQALRLYQDLDIPVWAADSLNMVGSCHARLGRYKEARTACETALSLHRRHHNPHGEANALDSLGFVARNTNRHNQAIDYYSEALHIFHTLGDVYSEADTANTLGEVLVLIGEQSDACKAWKHALNLYASQYRIADADHVQQQLAVLNDEEGNSRP